VASPPARSVQRAVLWFFTAVAAAALGAPATAGAGTFPGGGGYVTLLAFAGATQVLLIDQPLPADEPGAIELLDLGPLAGAAALRWDPDPLSGPELRLHNTTASALQGALVLGLAIPPTGGGPTGWSEFAVEYTDEGGGGLDETVQLATFFTEDDNRSTSTVVPELSFETDVTSESPLAFAAGPVVLPEPTRGDFFVELAVQLSFTLDAGDTLVLRGATAFPDPPPAVCADGFDNDGDGLIDFPEDPSCQSATQTTELPEPGGASGLAAGVFVLLLLARRRRP
jgi:uncharacterized protein (TIGR03382 family)